MIPIVYRWDDTDAPVLSGTAGSMVNLLTKCLVDGYGSKSGAGWILEFYNAELTKAAFKNNPVTCTGFFLLVDEVTPAANVVNMQGYELMTDIDNGVSPYYTEDYSVSKSSTSDTTSRPWLIVATDKFFHLVVWHTVTGDENVVLPVETRNTLFQFGDFVAANIDGFNSVLSMGYCYNNVVYGSIRPEVAGAAGDTYQAKYTRCPRNMAGDPDSSLHLWNGAIGGACGLRSIYSLMYSTTGAAYVPGRFSISKPYLGDASTYDLRGYMPGIYIPCHKAEDLETLTTITEDGRSFLLIRFGAKYSIYYSNIFIAIEIGVDWDA
jgi:hypothetical protein